jgi:glycine oxidase
MSDLNGLRVVVAGAGALGSVTALVLARMGAQVRLADPAGSGDNASGVAAGMLAPLFEALLDPLSAGHYPLLRQARDAWPGLVASLPDAPGLDCSGALLLTEDADVLIAQTKALGARLDLAAPAALPPELAAKGPWLSTPEDWRLEPRAMLAALHLALERAGGQRLPARLIGFEGGQARFEGAEPWGAEAVVLATGLNVWPGGQARLHPIKGQLLRFSGQSPAPGPVLRYRGVYLVPSHDGWVVGATMEEGVSDLGIDPQAIARLRAIAAEVLPGLAQAPFTASAGVRAATLDGLPLVGPSGKPGVLLAQGARRNGWLLAPLVAEVIADRLAGREPSFAAKAFHPSRLL